MNKNETVSLSVSDAIQHIGLDQLKPHPRNEEIYGCTARIADLVELIQLKGYVQPLTVKTDGTIVSGHRRWRALSALGWKFVPVIVRPFQTEDDELFVLVAENRHRHQSPVQRIREGIVVEPIARELRNRHAAKKARHQAAGSAELPSDNQQPLMENFPLNPIDLGLSPREMELTENIVAAIVGLGCGRNYRKGRIAVKAADELKKARPELAAKWLDIINDHSIDVGYQLAKIQEDKRVVALAAISSGAAKTPKQAKALIKAALRKSSASKKTEGSSSSEPVQESDCGGGCKTCTPCEPITGEGVKTHFGPDSAGAWVIVKIPFIPTEKIAERKWNGFWGRIVEVGATLKVDMGSEVVSLLQSDVVAILNPTPSFCSIAERILRLQSFGTVYEFGKIVLNRMQRKVVWDAAALAYLDAVEQVELARRAIEQAL
ncbi:ParB N-terminal domain-containing protein [Microcoleus sp. Pol11C1]|uniref:ParB N-terminal domain-containing protein n=1 Tax=unclassified Microcoleus TaxID=2642155 RepID=UPI002FD6F7BC